MMKRRTAAVCIACLLMAEAAAAGASARPGGLAAAQSRARAAAVKGFSRVSSTAHRRWKKFLSFLQYQCYLPVSMGKFKRDCGAVAEDIHTGQRAAHRSR